jgi:pyruvate,orthophosphate dikinase
MSKRVFFFGDGKAEGDAKRKDLLGGKGVGLVEMTALGLPVPPGFTISTEVCVDYMHNTAISAEIMQAVNESLSRVEASVGAKLGDPANPLLVSVRSGARASMPGIRTSRSACRVSRSIKRSSACARRRRRRAASTRRIRTPKS